MTRHILMALAGISLVAGGQALAQGRGHGHGNAGLHGSAGMAPRLHGGPTIVDIGGDRRGSARANSQGRFHASERARLRANRNSALFVDDDDIDIDARGNARVRSRGPDHASDRALARANERSVLRSRTVIRGPRKPR